MRDALPAVLMGAASGILGIAAYRLRSSRAIRRICEPTAAFPYIELAVTSIIATVLLLWRDATAGSPAAAAIATGPGEGRLRR
jgi:hypothetical protein